jgi:hypothetical protein
MIRNLALLPALLCASFVLAEPGWITDKGSGCSFFNLYPQPNETIKFEGHCNKTTAKGKLTWYLNGELNAIAEGQWKNGKETGQGTYRNIKSGSVYEGQFVDGKRTGKGTFRWTNGNSYEGDFLDGKRTGKGVFRWKDGSVYRGDFLDGKRTGKGSITWPNGTAYAGDFAEGKPSGIGTFVYKEGTRYTGEFLDGKFHGRGTMIGADGTKYVGEFLEGQNSGRGLLTLTNGVKYQGEWLRGDFSGPGIIIFPDGNTVAGRFQNGDFISDDSDPDHATCVKFGYAGNSTEYSSCRRQIEVAKQRAREEEVAYRQKLAQIEQQIEADRKEAAMLRGLSAIALGAGIVSLPTPTYAPPSPMHTYTLPGGRSMTCTTWGAFTNCH